MASSGTVTKRAETDRQQAGGRRSGSRAWRLVRRSVGLIGLFAVMLLAVGIGWGIRSPAPQERAYSTSEQAQLDAEHRYRSAADRARTTAADPALAPEAAAELAAAAADLDEQADAVALPRSPGPTADPGADATATSSSTSTDAAAAAGAAPADAPDLLAILRDSALLSLRDAARAEPGPSRVLAAAGVNQWRHVLQLGDALGVDPGLPSPDALSAVDLAAGTGPFAAPAPPAPAAPAADADAAGTADAPGSPADAGSSTPDGTTGSTGPDGPTSPTAPNLPAECAGTPLGPDSDRQALLTARTAEDQARYAYEVAAALLPEPTRAMDLASTHRKAAEAAADHLTALCVPPGPGPAGYAIGPDFRADPLAAAREIEQDHTELYAGLIATVGPEARAWAITSFSAAALRSLDAGTPLEALPGLAGSAPTPGSSATPEATPAPEAPHRTEQPGG
ncbi:hypothetical protein IWX63_000541 [Arthrobacter sp. CAN_A2]|uniref:DUF4439 domain-containing protein n=1 Tax=Arthrobacter sp. CAN_A2 TaxID=2787718 RepID=UPI0018EFFA4A